MENRPLIKLCKTVLNRFFEEHKRTYIDLFFYEKDIESAALDLTPLVDTKILRKIGKRFRANVQVFPLSGKFICTDFNYSVHRKNGKTYLTQKDGVWGILPDETPVIAKKSIVQNGDDVLDLATGSGMIAIFCADKAKKVIATDINPRAINYARFNAILNSVEEKIEFLVGDMFAPVMGRKFDLIIWNGPTVAVPKTDGKYPIYSDGGMDGAEFTRRFVDDAFSYTNSKGRLQWYDCAVGNKNLPVTLEYIKNKWMKRNVRIIFKSLTSTSVSLKKSFEIYAKYNLNQPGFKTPLSCKQITSREEKGWHNWLQKREYTCFYYGIVEVYPSNKFELEIHFPKKDIRTDRYLTRFWLWMSYATIIKKLKICEVFGKSERI